MVARHRCAIQAVTPRAYTTPCPRSNRLMKLGQDPYDARIVANTIVKLAAKERKTLSPMQVQKLIYIAHGWHLSLNDSPLVSQPILAWKHGPVVRDVYDEYRIYGSEDITHYYRSRDPETGIPEVSFVRDPVSKEIIESVWNSYKRFSATELWKLTHQNGSPWDRVYKGGVGEGDIIPNELIALAYKDLARERSAQNFNPEAGAIGG